MRYLTVYIDPQTGRERLGTGADSQCFHRYANIQNVIKFGLRKPAFPPGQYHIYTWPEAGDCNPNYVTAYKQSLNSTVLKRTA
jgi:hypothetical protein